MSSAPVAPTRLCDRCKQPRALDQTEPVNTAELNGYQCRGGCTALGKRKATAMNFAALAGPHKCRKAGSPSGAGADVTN